MFTTRPLEKRIRDHLETHTSLPDCDFKTDFDKLNSWLKTALEVKKGKKKSNKTNQKEKRKSMTPGTHTP